MDGSPLSATPVVVERPSRGQGEEEGLEATVRHLEATVVDVEAALARLERGTYGSCEVCGAAIDEARLTEEPTRALCAEHRPA